MTKELGAGASATPSGSREPSPRVLGPSGFDPSRMVEGEVLRPESCDAEIADIMAKLSKLQSWLVLQGCQHNGDRAFIAASTLIQDVRVLLVERCFNAETPNPSLRTITSQGGTR